MNLGKAGFIVDQYGWKSDCSASFWCKSSISNSNGIFETVYEIFMPLCKLGFITGKYGWKYELPIIFWWTSSISNFINICPTVCGMYGNTTIFKQGFRRSNFYFGITRFLNFVHRPVF
jgi:hypothetical protein